MTASPRPSPQCRSAVMGTWYLTWGHFQSTNWLKGSLWEPADIAEVIGFFFSIFYFPTKNGNAKI